MMKTQEDLTFDSCTYMFNEIPSGAIDHRCGAYHNTFDAKVRTKLMGLVWNNVENTIVSLHTFSWECGMGYIYCPKF